MFDQISKQIANVKTLRKKYMKRICPLCACTIIKNNYYIYNLKYSNRNPTKGNLFFVITSNDHQPIVSLPFNF
jgi:hypothetical protein